LLDLPHQLVTLTVFQRHKFAFTDTVLPRAGAAKFHCAGHNLIVDQLQLGPLFFIVRVSNQNDVQIAVTRMSKDISEGFVIIDQFLGKDNHFRVARNRNRSIHDQGLISRMGAVDCFPGFMAGMPEFCAFSGLRAEPKTGGPAVFT
jgi:hypothetical protein